MPARRASPVAAGLVLFRNQRLLMKRSANACQEASRLRLAAQPHRDPGHDQEPCDRIAGSKERDDDHHHDSGVDQAQDDHGERISRSGALSQDASAPAWSRHSGVPHTKPRTTSSSRTNSPECCCVVTATPSPATGRLLLWTRSDTARRPRRCATGEVVTGCCFARNSKARVPPAHGMQRMLRLAQGGISRSCYTRRVARRRPS
jgi:hypothetical protein